MSFEGGIEAKQGAGLLLGLLAVGVVQQLVFRPALVAVLARLDHVIIDAAVAHLADAPFEAHVEVGVFVHGDDVVGVLGIGADQQPVLHDPARIDPWLHEVAPALGVVAVEQQLPSRRLLRRRQSVERRAVIGLGEGQGGHAGQSGHGGQGHPSDLAHP